MKLLRVGEVGHEAIAALDKNNVIRDLSDQIDNLSADTFNNSLKIGLIIDWHLHRLVGLVGLGEGLSNGREA